MHRETLLTAKDPWTTLTICPNSSVAAASAMELIVITVRRNDHASLKLCSLWKPHQKVFQHPLIPWTSTEAINHFCLQVIIIKQLFCKLLSKLYHGSKGFSIEVSCSKLHVDLCDCQQKCKHTSGPELRCPGFFEADWKVAQSIMIIH